MIRFKALRIPVLTREVALNLERLFNNLPGIEQFSIIPETQELDIAFDKNRLSFQTLSQAMAQAGCPLRNINAALFMEVSSETMQAKQAPVKDWMTHNVVTVTPDITALAAYQLMTEKQIRRLPVLQDGRLVGIVTLGDVRPLGAAGPMGHERSDQHAQLNVKKIMTGHPLTISQDATIGQAAQMMLENKISGLPVVDANQKVAGIITESDIFRIVAQEYSKAL